jgi:hypothetical protein
MNSHTLNTQLPHKATKGERKREHGFKMIKKSNQTTTTTINENKNLWGCRLEMVYDKTICHWGFKPGTRVNTPYIIV